MVQVSDVDAEEVSKPNDRCRGYTDSPFGDLTEEVSRGGEGPPSGGAHGRGGHGVQHAQGPVGGGADTGKPVDRPMTLGSIHGEGVVGGESWGAERPARSAGAREQAPGVDGIEEVGKGMAAKDADVVLARGGVVEWQSGGVVEWWSGGVVEWWSGGVVEWCCGGVVEWWSGGVVQWLLDGVVEWWSGGVVEWRSG